MILGQSTDKLRVVCFGGGSSEGGSAGGSDIGFAGRTGMDEGRTSQTAADMTNAEFAGMTPGATQTKEEAGAFAADMQQQALVEQANRVTQRDFWSKVSNVATSIFSKGALKADATGLFAPKSLADIETDITNKAMDDAISGNKGARGRTSPDVRGGGMTPGITGNYGAASEGRVDDWLQSKPTSAFQGTSQNSVPVSQKQNQIEANPEEAAAAASQEEKKKARQRVGLMQMRNIDPLFMEGLPDIFRSKAR